ncbi:MAG TPA: hypothetical protein VK470_12380 [Bacteroidota bacterium]|nr:hypothetical protein [Bacteroidota bacterium]
MDKLFALLCCSTKIEISCRNFPYHEQGGRVMRKSTKNLLIGIGTAAAAAAASAIPIVLANKTSIKQAAEKALKKGERTIKRTERKAMNTVRKATRTAKKEKA